jgi:hypothetical protein
VLQQGVLRIVIEALGRAGVEYMLTGSVVSSLQGQPRATHDIDIVVAIRGEDIAPLLSSFPGAGFYFDRQAVQEAAARQSTFGVIDVEGGVKVDFWPLTETAFDQSRFGRRQQQDILGLRAFVSSPEDTILMKLRWAAMSGGSERQVGDARGVYEVQRGRLDVAYIDEWADRLGVRELWEKIAG